MINKLSTLPESVKACLEVDLGCVVCEEIYHYGEYDLIDAYDASREFLPPSYVISRENYIYGSCGGY